MGEPGLAYRYVRALGTSEQAYLADTTHLNYSWGLGTDGNSVWIAELWGHRALQYADTGAFLQAIGHAGFQLYAGQILYEVADVAVNATGHVWLVDVAAAHLLQFDADGAFVREVGRQWQPGSDNSHFVHPVSLAFDSAGNAYVSDGAPHWSADVGNQRIQVFDASGAYLTTIGVTGSVGQGNAHFHGPRHIAIYDNLLFDALKQARCRQIYQLL